MTDPVNPPQHLGLILDGNRRWAKSRGLPTLEGHRQGAENFRHISLAAFDRGIKYVSAYVFSNENWSRTNEEVGYLMKLLIKGVEKYLDDFHKAGVKVLVLGSREGLSKDVLKAIEDAETKTAHNTRGVMGLCFNYGGHQEIADAFKNLADHGVDPADVTPELIAEALYAPEVPEVDLIIRTSGEQRLSGYMLYRAAYAELIFIDKHWPDFTVEDLDDGLAEFARRQRRFGS
jgi:undecaprenyl diphosphate synthase